MSGQLSLFDGCKITVTTNFLSLWFRCETCNITLQNPKRYPTEWIKNHARIVHGEPLWCAEKAVAVGQMVL